jgi:hypothetical protein
MPSDVIIAQFSLKRQNVISSAEELHTAVVAASIFVHTANDFLSKDKKHLVAAAQVHVHRP